jgi:hypothetical protein
LPPNLVSVKKLPATLVVAVAMVPSFKIRNLSVGEFAPSAVVENTNSVGISLAPGVPFILANIFAPCVA